MTQEDKELLLKDISARLPYGVKCAEVYPDGNKFENEWDIIRISKYVEDGIHISNCKTIYGYCSSVENIKPYLFPMSSMTEEQKRDLTNLFNCTVVITEWEIVFPNYYDNNMDNWNKVFNWCYKNHFDCNGLIPLGLALKAPDGMYN